MPYSNIVEEGSHRKDVQFTPDQEARLAQIARREGKNAGELWKDAALRLLDEDACFRSTVQEGKAYLDRGDRKPSV